MANQTKGGGAITQAMLAELTPAERRALFVRVGMRGNAASVKLVPRFRLNPANVNRVFNCDVEFLQEDATGTVVWPKNWAAECLPPPYLYFVSEKQWPQLDADTMEMDEYRGKTIVVVDNAPEDAPHAVVLRWLSAGLDDDDPELAMAKMQLLKMEADLQAVEQQIKEMPTMKGQGNNAQEELENKRKMAEALTLQKADLEEAIRKVKAKEEDMRQEQLRGGSSGGFRVKLAETKMPQRLNVWRVRMRACARASAAPLPRLSYPLAAPLPPTLTLAPPRSPRSRARAGRAGRCASAATARRSARRTWRCTSTTGPSSAWPCTRRTRRRSWSARWRCPT